MNPPCEIRLAGACLTPLPSGALWWEDARLLCVSDLHLGKSERMARRWGALLPPYETRDTLIRLETDLLACRPATVVCLGDSFDDLAAAEGLDDGDRRWLLRLQEGRRWLWIEGNHDPGPVAQGGRGMPEHSEGPLIFRHIARTGAEGEVSGHWHPKAEVAIRGGRITRPCFLYDERRLVMPAYGTYTGGLSWTSPRLRALFAPGASAALIGHPVRRLPVPAA